MSAQDYLSIAIPIYNESAGALSLIEKTLSLPFKKEVIIVNDASTQEVTKNVLAKIKKNWPEVKILQNEKNLGKSASVQKALKIAQGNLFIILDGDGELDPEDIIALYRTLKQTNARFVSGVRVIKGKINLNYTSFVSRIAKKLCGIFLELFYQTRVKDVLSGFKLFYTEDFRNYNFATQRFGLETELFISTIKNQRKFVETDVAYLPRTYKQGKKINLLDSGEILQFFLPPLAVLGLGIILSLFSFALYTFNANAYPTTDSLPNNFTAVNLIYQKRLDLTNFQKYFQKRQITHYVAVKNNQGKLYGKTPVINGILAAPFFYFFDKWQHRGNVSSQDFLKRDYETYYQAVGKYYASFLISIGIFVIYLVLFALGSDVFWAFVFALAFGFGTMVYSTAAQGNWQHAPSLFLLSVASYLLLNFLKTNRQILLLLIAVFLALASLIRPSNILFFPAIIFILWFSKQYRTSLVLPTICFFVLIFLGNLFMSALGIPGGYNQEILQSFASFNLISSLRILPALLVSPNVGLLIFNPLFIFSFLGIIKLVSDYLIDKREWEKPNTIFLLIASLSFFLLLFFNTFWWAWEGGYSWGPRLLTEGIPSLIFLGAYFILAHNTADVSQRMNAALSLCDKRRYPDREVVGRFIYAIKQSSRKFLFSLVFTVLFIYSVAVHAVGVYAYDTGWHYKYYEGRERIAMAWFNNPNIISYYLFTKRIFFKHAIINTQNGLFMEKKFYRLDFKNLNLKLIKKELVAI